MALMCSSNYTNGSDEKVFFRVIRDCGTQAFQWPGNRVSPHYFVARQGPYQDPCYLVYYRPAAAPTATPNRPNFPKVIITMRNFIQSFLSSESNLTPMTDLVRRVSSREDMSLRWSPASDDT